MDKENRLKIWERIKTGGATSIVLGNTNSDIVTELLAELYDELKKSFIIPVSISCDNFHTSNDFWKGMVNDVLINLRPQLSANTLEAMKIFLNRIAKPINVIMLKNNFEKVLKTAKQKEGLTILLILKDFDNLFDFMTEPGLMMIRGLTSSLTLMIITTTPIEILANEHNLEKYFYNQIVNPLKST